MDCLDGMVQSEQTCPRLAEGAMQVQPGGHVGFHAWQVRSLPLLVL